MRPIFEKLDLHQEASGLPWQTKRLRDFPQALPRLAAVTAMIEMNYCPPTEWNAWLAAGSVTFQHREHARWVVKVFVDDGNRLALRNGLSLSDDPIVVGVDLTDRDLFSPFLRHTIRLYLRSAFVHYVDPEAAVAPDAGGKIWLKPDDDHWFDYLFLPDGPCEMPYEESRAVALMEAVGRELTVW